MPATIKCVITDDEPVARRGLKNYIDKIDFLELVGVCEDAIQLNSLLRQQPVDLLFLDIEMPYVSGIDFLKNYPNPPKVIFTTAYERYAISGYELDVLDYLLKPISFERFLKAANKAYDFFTQQLSPVQEFIFVKTDNKLEKIWVKDILFIEALANYVAIYLVDKKLVIHSTLKGLLEKLPAAEFIQPHKSYLVHTKAISSIEGNLLNVDKYQVPISKYQKEQVLSILLNKGTI